jgi:hypothetical protein
MVSIAELRHTLNRLQIFEGRKFRAWYSFGMDEAAASQLHSYVGVRLL